MMKKHALEHFRRPPLRLNCAQSILYAYQQLHGETALSLPELKSFGGGRAPDGLCGALHVACALVPDRAEQIKSEFAATTGSLFCRELRAANQHPCETCVSASAQLLEVELGVLPPKTA